VTARPRSKAVLIDVDGTLVDSVYQHAVAWSGALRAHGYDVPAARAHRVIGMRGPRLLDELLDGELDDGATAAIDADHAARFDRLHDLVCPLPGARALLAALRERRVVTILVSSAPPEEVEGYVELLDARELVAGWTSAADGERSKPDPEPVRIALQRSGCTDALVVGDAPWDCEAAAAAGLPFVGVLTGGYAASELEAAGACSVFDDPAALCAQLDGLV
jgi:HAD superfamily hydrolase (TIGR01509 family)